MFGKRQGPTSPEPGAPARADSKPAEAAKPRLVASQQPKPQAAAPASAPAAAAPKVDVPKKPAAAAGGAAPLKTKATEPKAHHVETVQIGDHSQAYYEQKTSIFNTLIDTIDLAQLAQMDIEGAARGNPRHRQRDHPAQECRDVDLGAGKPASGHLQRRSRLWSARAAAWRATTSPTSWSMVQIASSSR